MYGLLSFLGQATPVPAADIVTMATDAAADVVAPEQLTYIVLAAVGISMGIWVLRRTLKLGR